MGRPRRTGDFIAAHPSVDWTLAACGTLVGARLTVIDSLMISAFFQGLAAAAGLILAAATFGASMMYQSTSPLVVRIRRNYAALLNRNWASIFATSLAVTILAVFLLLFSDRPWATSVGLAALGLLLARGTRSIFWIYYVLVAQRVDQESAPMKAPGLKV